MKTHLTLLLLVPLAIRAAEPTRLRALATELEAWNRELIPPAFPGAAARNQGNAAKKKNAGKKRA